MEFDKSRVYTALNADELKIGSKVFVADTLQYLKEQVETDNFVPSCLVSVNDEECVHRFVTEDNWYVLAYLVEEPQKKVLKWTELKVGDVIRKKMASGYRTAMVTAIDSFGIDHHIFTGESWLCDGYLAKWEKVEE